MMKRMAWTIALVGSAGLEACRSGGQQTTGTAQPTTSATGPQKTLQTRECYAYLSAQDTVRLTLIREGDTISGDLLYQLSGKDRNTGTLQGQVRGDTLLAAYTFRSEGVTSTREVAFLRVPNGLIEGYGPVQERQGRQVFSNRATLAFNGSIRLISAECRP